MPRTGGSVSSGGKPKPGNREQAAEHLRREDVEPEVDDAEAKRDARRGLPVRRRRAVWGDERASALACTPERLSKRCHGASPNRIRYGTAARRIDAGSYCSSSDELLCMRRIGSRLL